MEIKELAKIIIQFRNDRNWEQFHTLKDILLGLNIEVSELAELFLWKSESEMLSIPREKVANEIADIFIILNYISYHFNLDIEKAVLDKIDINNKKYPIEKSYGNNKKYDEL
jgi:NTP pyrophosphatase (non-canonical NTP hydrolase)